MGAAFLMTFRESLEAALIVGILLSAIRELGDTRKSLFVWFGAFMGVVLSIILAWIIGEFTTGFTGALEKIYEGSLMLLAVFIITHLVFWMRRQEHSIISRIKTKVKDYHSRGFFWMIALLAMISVAREGIEIIIFFQAILIQSNGVASLWEAFLGGISAIGLSCIVFFSTKKLPLSVFFRWTGYFLILVAAGLLAHGIVELQGASIIPTIIKPIVDISSILSEKEGLGSFLKAIFGYDANPSLLAMVAYFTYLGVVLRFFSSTPKKTA